MRTVFPLIHHRVASSLLSTLQGDASFGKTSSSDAATAPWSMQNAFDATVMNRFACKKFQRYDGWTNATTIAQVASPADPAIVLQAWQCLDVARRAPTGFNTQPYRVVLVQSVEQKTAMAKYCSGPNAQRVRDSDCTVVFLADRQILRTLPKFLALTQRKATTTTTTTKPTLLARLKKLRLPFYIFLFSSGYPLPRFLAAPISIIFRFFFHLLSLVYPIPLPTLSSSETWSIKNTMNVAMTYLLACTSRGINTSPMEGFSAWGIRKVLKIPSRYAIPVIVSTGRAAPRMEATAAAMATTAIMHGNIPVIAPHAPTTPRYPLEQLVFQDAFDLNPSK
jgi:nitroreductase